MSSLGSIAGSLLGGAAGASSAPLSVNNYYPNASQYAGNYQTLAGNSVGNANAAQSAVPAAQNTFNAAYNNPFSGQLQAGANTAGSALQNLGTTGLNNSTALSSSSASLLPYIQQILSQGANPQGALYNQQSQNSTDQANTTNAQYGLTGPYAANATNQANQNFNQNWQNNALQRAIQALTSGASTLNAAGSGMNTAQSIGGQGAQDIYSGAGLPYNAANTITGNQSNDINSLINSIGGVNNIDSGTMSQLLSYLDSASGYGINQNKQENTDASAGASGGANLGGEIGSAAVKYGPAILSAFGF